MKRLHKNTVKKIIRDTGSWKGYIVASNVAEYHINGGWHIGSEVEVTSIDELDRAMASYAYYNCCYELGYRVVCYSK